MLEGNYVQWQSHSKAKYGSVAELCSKAGSRPMAESLKGGIWLGGRIMLEGRITPNGGVAQRRNMAQRPMSCTKAATLEGGQLCSKADVVHEGNYARRRTVMLEGRVVHEGNYARRRTCCVKAELRSEADSRSKSRFCSMANILDSEGQIKEELIGLMAM
ncbi:hypothetical protein GGX14DRAFT_586911 [Mycena pura]|uniref:Uncharacterized protein n=1 Tax=Mycena pura TaxID=153505 RepID=A0AAD6UTI2_9AGAR|nr:hypothetical protein GGX14DRAFT_586911 [Mycena pura]